MSRYLVDEIERREQVEVCCHCEIVGLSGGQALESVLVRDTRTGDTRELQTRALFVFIGASPHTDWLHHRVLITGPAADLAYLRAAAGGAGTWVV